MIRSNGRVPLYLQLKQEIRRKIESREWPAGSRIPGEHALAVQLGASRETLRKALDGLAREGLIVRRSGDGTYVSVPKIEQRLGSFYSFSKEIRSLGMSPSTEILDFSVIHGDPLLLGRLQQPRDSLVYRIRRLRLADGAPFAAETSFVPCAPFPRLTRALVDEFGLYGAMAENSSCMPDEAQETFGAVLLSREEAKLLQCDVPAAALYLERIATADGLPVEFCTSVVRGDRYQYHVLLQRSPQQSV